MALISGIFSIGPRTRADQGRLVATTAWRYRLLTLGASLRQVIVDSEEKVVRVRRRVLWLFRRRKTIPFAAIKSITYGYDRLLLPQGHGGDFRGDRGSQDGYGPDEGVVGRADGA
jgi:hypothetical protein